MPKEYKVRKRRFWLTKVHGGRYMLSFYEPTKGHIRGTAVPEVDAPFDPLGVRQLCEPGIIGAFGEALEPLTPTRVEMTFRILPKK